MPFCLKSFIIIEDLDNCVIHCPFRFTAGAFDDECRFIDEEADCQDIRIQEEETQDVDFKAGANELPASFDVQLQVPSQPKLNKYETEGRNAHELVLSSKNCSAPVTLSQDNSHLVHINTGIFSLKDNRFQAESNQSDA